MLHVGAPLDTQAARTERRRPGAVVAAAPTPEHPHADVIQGLSKQAPPLQIPAPAAVPALPPLGSGKHEYVFVDTPSHLAACAMVSPPVPPVPVAGRASFYSSTMPSAPSELAPPPQPVLAAVTFSVLRPAPPVPLQELFEQDRIALDVEHHATHSYAGQTCLLQLSTGACRRGAGATALWSREPSIKPQHTAGSAPCRSSDGEPPVKMY